MSIFGPAGLDRNNGTRTDPHSAADTGTQSQLLDERTVRVTRILHGTPRQVWDAHHDPAVLDRWFHGPDGWALVGCRVASEPGETTRFEWAPGEGVEGELFALTGELLETDPPHREVFTETMEGADAPPTKPTSISSRINQRSRGPPR